MTPNTNNEHPVFMNANGGSETHVETTLDHDRAVERPPEETESQAEITETGQNAKMRTQGKPQTRTKKIKLENGEEPPQDLKRNRTRASHLKKERV